MNSDTWTAVKEAGDRWHELAVQLTEARQHVAELEQQEAAAHNAFQDAMVGLQIRKEEAKSEQRKPCKYGCGKLVYAARAGRHYEHCPNRPSIAAEEPEPEIACPN